MSDIIIIHGRKYRVLSRTNFDGCVMEEIEEYKESDNFNGWTNSNNRRKKV